METINDVIEMNNEGVSFLLSGKDKMAAGCLVKALGMVKRRLTCHDVDVAKSIMIPRQQQCAPNDCSDTVVSGITAESSGTMFHSVSPLCSLFDDGYFIYNQAIIIPPNAPRDLQALTLYSACITLNIGLAYHHRARTASSITSEASLRKAEIMYGAAARVASGDLDAIDNSCCTRALVCIVAVNNLSHIHFEQGNIQRARAEVAQLSIFMSRYASFNQILFTQDELKSLLLNVALQGGLRIAPAA